MKLLFLILTVLTAQFLLPSASGQQEENPDFQCDVPENAQEINITSSSGDFSTVAIGGGNCGFLVPKEIYWHVYAMEEGSSPKHSMFPPGLVKAEIGGGTLRYTVQDVLKGYAEGDSVQAGVNLYIPLDMMKTIILDGVGQWVEVYLNSSLLADMDHSGRDPIRIDDSGVDSHLLVLSPYLKVDVVGSGVDNTMIMEVASDSSLDLSGVDQQVSIKCPEGLEIRMTGVSQDVVVEGQLSHAVMDGVDGVVEVNNGMENACANVTTSGVASKCKATDDAVVVPALPCLSDTVAGYVSSWYWPLSTGASIGLAIGILVVASLSLFGCIYCACKGCRNNRAQKASDYNSNPHEETAKSCDDTHGPVVHAEVLEIQNVGQNDYQVDNPMVDVEMPIPEADAKVY